MTSRTGVEGSREGQTALVTMTASLDGGRYQLGALLGTGGMSQVRRATDTLLGRDVAVKVFREDLDDDSAARARQEMQTLAALHHPRLVAVHDAGTDDGGRPYLVMELIDGPTLADRCRDRSLTPACVTAIGAELAEALTYVHSLGIVHRDVKPANVLLPADGARLADFGVARIVDSARHTGTGLTVGTAPYLSPEQVTGGSVGPPADIYSLGLVLLECLTGRREYDGNPVEAALARLHREPQVPASLDAPWPELLRAMTARQAEDRPTAEQVVAVLRGETDVAAVLREGAPTTVLAPTEALRVPLRRDVTTTDVLGLRTPADPDPVPRRRTPLIAALVTAGVLVLVGVVGAVGGGGGGTDSRPVLDQHLSQLHDAVRP